MNISWKSSPLEELCHVEYGTRVVKKRDGGTKFPVYGGGGATFFMDEFNRKDQFIISRFAMSEKCTRFVEGYFFLNDSGLSLKPKNTQVLNQRFLDYQCLSLNDVIYFLGKGAGQRNLHVDSFKKLLLVYPPPSVQKQIVKKLDAAFADIDKTISATQKNIENVEALFQSHLNKIYETESEDWKTLTIEKSFTIKPPKTEVKELPMDTEVSFMGMNQLGINQKYSIPEEARKLEKVHKNYTYFSENDVLLAKITPCFENGKLGIAKNLQNGIGFGSSEFVVLRKKLSISNEWLYYFLLRDEFRNSGKAVMTGAVGHKRVPKEFIEQTQINFPNLTVQGKIINDLESVQNQTSKIKKIQEDKIKNLNALKSSLLNQAFSGELIKDAA